MAIGSVLYQHAVTELRLKGLLGSGEPLPDTYVSVVLIVVDHFDDFRMRTKNTAAGLKLVNVLLVNLPLKRACPALDDFGIEQVMRLISQLPLTLLTGDQKEWSYKSPGHEYNKRCPRIVREAGGETFDTEFMTKDGKVGRIPVGFPYLPERNKV